MNSRIEVIKGDITKQEVDAIVNAANSSLMGGGGVDGAIHRAGGGAILDDCRKIIARQGTCATGEAVITTAGCLPAKYVIHTVGPVWREGKYDEGKKLSDCYENSLKLAVKYKIETIAFPNISTGMYGFPREKAASIATTTVLNDMEHNRLIKTIRFICFDHEN